jgi:hypothetical protein
MATRQSEHKVRPPRRCMRTHAVRTLHALLEGGVAKHNPAHCPGGFPRPHPNAVHGAQPRHPFCHCRNQ